jgi:hypothetical protein
MLLMLLVTASEATITRSLLTSDAGLAACWGQARHALGGAACIAMPTAGFAGRGQPLPVLTRSANPSNARHPQLGGWGGGVNPSGHHGYLTTTTA